MPSSVSVRVPASTANLGPGFDCLAAALDLWNETYVEIGGNQTVVSIEGEGAGQLPEDENNLLVQSAHAFARQMGQRLPPGLRIRCKNAIPLSSGLGSSAAAVLAGAMAANALLDYPGSSTDLLTCATQIEGHADNAAASLMGGLVAVAQDQGQVIVRRWNLPALQLVVITPDFELSTREARAALPDQYSRADAVFNISRTVMVVEALRSADLDLLSRMMDDRLHQPYRLPLIPGAEQAFRAARSVGSTAVALSGAGPSLLAVADNPQQAEDIAAAMQSAFAQAGLTTRIFTPSVSARGAEVNDGR
ncbi:MAG: homoserine kinase [Anaerolineaceae bacterium]